jgi:hypothetical protein
MTRMSLLTLLFAASTACDPGPGVARAGPFQLLEEGEGPVLAEQSPFLDGALFVYYVSTRSSLAYSALDGFLDHDGLLLEREVTEDEVVYFARRDDATLFYGTDRAGILDEGVVTASYPLKAGRRWTAGVASFPDLFEFHVVGAETIETPAGIFETVRIDQTNRRENVDVARWHAPGLGLIHRVGADGFGGPIAHTTLIEYAIPGAP